MSQKGVKMKSIIRLSLVVLGLSLFIPATAYSWQWSYYKDVDDFSDRIDHSSHAISKKPTRYQDDYAYLGVRCTGNKNFLVTVDAGYSIATPSSPITILIKVDENTPFTFRGTLYSNSYNSGAIRLSPNNVQEIDNLIKQFKAGNEAKVRIVTEGSRDIVNFSVTLTGFTKTSAPVLAACGRLR